MSYDQTNVFARILRGEIPAEKVLETEYALAFKDIKPKAPVHILVIPTGPYSTMDDFVSTASAAEILGFSHAVLQVVKLTELDKTGYRLISNNGGHGGQEVPHYHVHVVGGTQLWDMLPEL
jgi:diadenosine tetraphosphate (Ap4A) HIT family hydrolase